MKSHTLKCFLLLVCTVASVGQVTTGSITGYVFDPEGRPIQNAKVTATGVSRLSELA
jgi:hypothetical protein